MEVLVEGTGGQLLVLLPDGSSMRIPRPWTDADGASIDLLQGDVIFTSGSLRELLALVEALARRP